MRRLVSAVMFVNAAVAHAEPLPDADQNAVKTAILSVLRDPDSAKFSYFSSSRQPSGETIVCGTVNSKNGFGGYVGAMPFSGKLYADGNFYLTKLAESPAEQGNLIALCQALGAPIVE